MPIHGYPGNVITANPTAPTSSVATGVWTTEQQLQAVSQGNWPGYEYPISRSLRFNSADSAYLNRTPASASNRRIFTWSGWVKRCNSATTNSLFAAYVDANNFFLIHFRENADNGRFEVFNYSSAFDFRVETNALLRDPSAWYHIVVALDTTQATSSNRIKIYVNGTEQTLATTSYPSLDFQTDVNNTNAHNIGADGASGRYHNGYMTEVNFIDGQALTPSSFGLNDPETGVWSPKRYTGTYGTNGFYLNFSDNSGTTSTTLGKDSSGNGNNWTPNNFSVTAGAGNDSMVDSPTSYGTDTGVGGEVRGNYCTFNPLVGTHSNTYSDGNLQLATSTANAAFSHQRATFGVSSGKWYWEITCQATNTAYYVIGLASDRLNPDTQHLGNGSSGDGYLYRSDTGNKGTGGTYTAYGNTFTTGDIIGVAYDADNGKLWFSKNGTWQNSGSPSGGTNEAFSSITGTYYPAVTDFDNNTGRNSTFIANFGQRAFAYTAPSGFKALCTQNLPTPTIGATSTTQANQYFDVKLATGSNIGSVTLGAFSSVLAWIKDRVNINNHQLLDSVRGTSGSDVLQSNTTSGTVSYSTPTGNSVGWVWKANGAGSSNTAGTITSTVSANTTSGFSIVTYTGTGANATVGHGLGVAPQMIITKPRNSADNWISWHTALGATGYIYLNLTNASATGAAVWNSTLPTSTVFSLGTSSNANSSGQTQVAYCFAPVAGYSAFGSYTGNGSADGPFVYTGFRPKYVMIKNSTTGGAGYDWFVWDSVRDAYNLTTLDLNPNSSQVENTNSGDGLDILSNGFKIRVSTAATNTSGNTFIYACFAESPFKYSLAR